MISIPQLPKETSTESLSSQEALPLTMRRETDKGVVLCCSNYPQVITLSFSGLWRLNVSQQAGFPDLFTKEATRLGRSCEWVQTRVARDKLSFHWGVLIHQTQPCSKYLWQSRRLYGASGSPTGGSQHRPPGHGNKDMPSLLTSLLLRSHSWLVTWHLQRLTSQPGNSEQPCGLSCPSWTGGYLILQINKVDQNSILSPKGRSTFKKLESQWDSWSPKWKETIAGDTGEGHCNHSSPGSPGNIVLLSLASYLGPTLLILKNREELLSCRQFFSASLSTFLSVTTRGRYRHLVGSGQGCC